MGQRAHSPFVSLVFLTHHSHVISFVDKVFPAAEIEGFLVHHRTNSENGMRGESDPAVPISMVRFLAEQFLRDGKLLKNTERRLHEPRR